MRKVADEVGEELKKRTGGAVGAGLVLVLVPSLALYFGTETMGGLPVVGLPILAIFGIMILFGALALVATLFARLGLSDKREALALPEGSIRAAIALALIVLFAIISIMLYQTLSKPYVIGDLGEEQKNLLVKELANRVIAVVPQPCTNTEAAGEKCPEASIRYAVHVLQPPAQESTDLAKQLLVLIGTLMTSVTSFYFASRATEPKRDEKVPPSAGAGVEAAAPDDEGDADGCDVPIVYSTRDEDLPASRGGVAP